MNALSRKTLFFLPRSFRMAPSQHLVLALFGLFFCGIAGANLTVLLLMLELKARPHHFHTPS